MMTNNVTYMFYISHQGRWPLCVEIIKLWNWWIATEVISASYLLIYRIPQLMISKGSSSKWQMGAGFTSPQQPIHIPNLEVDLFATIANKKCKKFCSREGLDPQSLRKGPLLCIPTNNIALESFICCWDFQSVTICCLRMLVGYCILDCKFCNFRPGSFMILGGRDFLFNRG